MYVHMYSVVVAPTSKSAIQRKSYAQSELPSISWVLVQGTVNALLQSHTQSREVTRVLRIPVNSF